jgi:hypothetical protein
MAGKLEDGNKELIKQGRYFLISSASWLDLIIKIKK